MIVVRSIVGVVVMLWAAPAFGDGEVMFRGAYYKEEATRVQQPMIDARLDLGTHGELDTHFLVDVITSASVSAGNAGEEFSEIRYEHGAAYMHRIGDARVGAGYRVSTEPDYLSLFATVRGELELAQKNTIIAGAFAQGSDDFNNGQEPDDAPGGARTGDMRTSIGSLSISQVLSPVVVGALTYDLAYISGDQENLYREVAVGEPDEVAEEVPDERTRHAVFGSLRSFVVPTRTTLVAGYRYYQDDWGIRAHTPEARVIQDLGGGISARLRYRYYRQTAADFYRDTYDFRPEFRTDDPKLSKFTTQTVGLTLWSPLSELGITTGRLGKVRAQVTVEYINQTNRFGDAVAAQIGFTMPVEY